MNTLNQFQYIYANLWLYQFQADWMMLIISLISGIVLMVGSYMIMRQSALYSISYHADRVLAHKKKTLGNLILMKDIQTELEKEIEQAILKAAFHS
jgi:hypothetical protein